MAKQVIAAVVVVLLMAAAAYAAFFVAPTERSMGLIQRIFYLHVPSAWTAFTAFFICFIANLQYVFRRQPRWDWLGVSSAEVGLTFTTVVLVTGPIWAHPVWGILWTWDARLTSTFVLWLALISYRDAPNLRFARGYRAIEKLLEPGQIAWRGRNESELFFSSSADRIRLMLWNRFF